MNIKYFVENYKEYDENEINFSVFNIYSFYKDYVLSEEFIDYFCDKVDWFYISSEQILSEKFIEKHINKVTWLYIFTDQVLSDNFIEKHKNKIMKAENISEEQFENWKKNRNKSIRFPDKILRL